MSASSHPTMGAWIEIVNVSCLTVPKSLSHPTMGAWIEIVSHELHYKYLTGSHPTMGAWIEIIIVFSSPWILAVAPHDGCVDWNIISTLFVYLLHSSHPTMGAWIEIWTSMVMMMWQERRTPRWVRGLKLHLTDDRFINHTVAPHDGCVDWNRTVLIRIESIF